MLNAILVDSGPLIALFDRSDNYHDRIKTFLRDFFPCRLVSTLAVLTEVSHMLDFSIDAQLDFLEWVMRGGLCLEAVEQDDMAKLTGLIRKYRDLPCDLADATLVLVAEKTGIHSIISIDSDFDIYRLPGKMLIKNIFRG
ncbi:MAG: PIN domain-containing protein [Treponema sp.]|nr:PIN domain-containing protein [Treponema sp.]